MKRFLTTITLCLAFGVYGFAQGSDDTPATKEDVQRYFDVMHSRDLINKMMEAMLKPMHQMMHDQYMKDKDKLPADFETRMNRIIDDMLREMPWEEIIQAEMPAFQKHLTKGDVDSIVAFYSSPSGTKTLEGNAGNHGRVHAVDDADYPAVCRKNEHPRSGGNG